jgi:hypothetical protein
VLHIHANKRHDDYHRDNHRSDSGELPCSARWRRWLTCRHRTLPFQIKSNTSARTMFRPFVLRYAAGLIAGCGTTPAADH